ncbi:hypothetical protein PG993_006935 [Apiospora rasikravindrae]|uniref:Uncharacterized protein n=1 Tax=Apiospora rasikravindrae TaxID=990691 RepID=A0ABR1SXS6_9PEZI
MPPLHTTLAVLCFFVLYLAVVCGGAYLFSRAGSSSWRPVERRGELLLADGESGLEDSGGDDDDDGDEEEDLHGVRNYHAWSHYSLVPDTDVDSFSSDSS